MPDRSSKEEGRLGRDLEEAKVGECHHFPTIGDHGLGQGEYGEECKVWISDGQRERSTLYPESGKKLSRLGRDRGPQRHWSSVGIRKPGLCHGDVRFCW